MDFNNMVDQVCMLCGLTEDYRRIFKRYRYIDLEVNGKKIFYLQEDMFYGTITHPDTEEEKTYKLKSNIDFANMLYDLNLIIDSVKEVSATQKYLFIYKDLENYIIDFTIIDEEEAKERRETIYNCDEEQVLFDIEVNKGFWDNNKETYIDIKSGYFHLIKITPSEEEALTSVFGGSPFNICNDFYKNIREYTGDDE